MAETFYRILIIDDSPEDRELYRRLLEHDAEGEFLFAEAETAEDGLAELRSFKPDCVLLDYRLPGLDGLNLLEHHESDPAHSGAAIIMLTGQGSVDIAVEALKTGAQDYLIKSKITAEALRRAVLNAIEKVRMQHELARKQAELQRLASEDELTGLSNRRHLLTRLEEELGRSRRYRLALSVLLIDLDHFKRINDTYGHLIGDEVLERLGQMLRGSLRRSDLAGRFGGEEFCVVAAHTNADSARAFAERIRRMVGELNFAPQGKPPFHVTCSIGVATADEATTATQLLARADEALYRAKNNGRNCVCVYGQD